MKLTSAHIDLKEVGTNEAGEPLWVDIPKGVTEGFVFELNEMRSALNAAMAALAGTNGETPGTDRHAETDGLPRQQNLMMLDTVIAWNLDDDKGKVLPLTKTLKGEKERLAVLAQVPVDALTQMADTLLNVKKPMSEGAEDFSKTSSDQPPIPTASQPR